MCSMYFFYIELLHVMVYSEKHHELLIFYAILEQGMVLIAENLVSLYVQDLVELKGFCISL